MRFYLFYIRIYIRIYILLSSGLQYIQLFPHRSLKWGQITTDRLAIGKELHRLK
jgi:hypothetical protein